jgi:hypothetical protein
VRDSRAGRSCVAPLEAQMTGAEVVVILVLIAYILKK